MKSVHLKGLQARMYDNDLRHKAEHEVIHFSHINPPIPPPNESHQGCFWRERKPPGLHRTAGRYMCVLDLQDEGGVTVQSDCCLKLRYHCSKLQYRLQGSTI